MDFTSFFNSSFYKKSSYQLNYNHENETVTCHRTPHSMFTVNILNDNLISSLEEIGSASIIHPDLYYLLYYSSLKSEYVNLITNQWLEVRYHLNLSDSIPWMSNLYILPKNSTVRPHKHHSPKNKNTVSFIYQFNHDGDSTVTVSDSVFNISGKEKVILNMYNNPMHSAHFNSDVTFVWANELTDVVKFTDETTSTYYMIGDKQL